MMRSAKYFKAAADGNDAVGQFNYDVCCYPGEGAPINFGEAEDYFRLSSNQHYGPACRAYWNCVAHGRGVAVMIDESLIYLYRSSTPDGIRWDDVRPSEKPISVESFTPIRETPNYVIENKTEKAIPVTATVTVPEIRSRSASVYQRRNKPMRMMLHPDIIRGAHLSEFEVDMSSLREVEKLGFGGFGTVKLMVSKSLYEFAVKYCSLPHGTRAFRREIESMCRLNHPCVIPCYGFSLRSEGSGRREGVIMMKYAKNGSLADVLNSVRAGNRPTFWNSTEIAIVVCGIVSGLEFIHSQGIVHRDIKPANILLDGRFHSLIGDFGSSKMISAGCRPSCEVTTPLYEAREL
jgi:hypothetical protein